MRQTVKKIQREYVMAPDKILVRRDSSKKQSAGGLHIPDNAAQTEFTGVVIAAGRDVPPDLCKVGDQVLYGNMYQMLNAKGQDAGTIVLKYPAELMYVFRDSVAECQENDEEYTERVASEARRAQLTAGGRLE